MQSGFPSDFKEQVRSRIDIVDLIGESLTLQPERGGREYKGLCPFHDDHNPSFTVSREKQSYKCWSCGEGGDCFSFVMKIDGLQFIEALEQLAGRANLEMPRSSRSLSPEQRGAKKSLYDVLEWAEKEFHRCLIESPDAESGRKYLQERGYDAKIIEQFRLGFHPGGWEWLLNKARNLFSPQQLFAAKLVRERSGQSGYYDDFRGRVLFPIRDVNSRPVAFGGRVLPEDAKKNPDAPKYLNSAESDVFSKSTTLYGMHVARDAIRKAEAAIVVEGYTDCIHAHRCGINNVVGVLGTALTDRHVATLKRFVKKVILVYDGDEAGQKAAERALGRFLAQEVDLRIMTLPQGLDPADFLEKEGIQSFQEKIASAPEAWEHKLQVSIHQFGLQTIDARQRILDEMLELVSVVPNFQGTIRETIVLSKLSQRVSLDERIVRKRLIEFRQRRQQSESRSIRFDNTNQNQQTNENQEFNAAFLYQRERSKYDKQECELLEIVFAIPSTIEEIQQQISVDDLENKHLKRLLQFCFDLAEQGTEPSYSAVTAALENPDMKGLVADIEHYSEEKGIKEILLADGTHDAGKTRYPFLTLAVQNIKRRQQEQANEPLKSELAGRTGQSETISDKDRSLLQKLNTFHAQRATRKELNK